MAGVLPFKRPGKDQERPGKTRKDQTANPSQPRFFIKSWCFGGKNQEKTRKDQEKTRPQTRASRGFEGIPGVMANHLKPFSHSYFFQDLTETQK
jgi:hypothetical protein